MKLFLLVFSWDQQFQRCDSGRTESCAEARLRAGAGRDCGVWFSSP